MEVSVLLVMRFVGFMDTDMTKTIPDKVKEKMVGAIPVGRIGTPEDIANAAAF